MALSAGHLSGVGCRRSLFYGTDWNGTEQFGHIILRNGTGSNAVIRLPKMSHARRNALVTDLMLFEQ